MDVFPGRLAHQTPGWVDDGAKFHIRIRALAGQNLIQDPIAGALLASIEAYHNSEIWWCTLALVMPDHLHAILAFCRNGRMSGILRNWKRGTTRLYGVCWQTNYFDHRLRTPVESEEAWRYIRQNPVVLGLCQQEEDWPWWWSALSQSTERLGRS